MTASKVGGWGLNQPPVRQDTQRSEVACRSTRQDDARDTTSAAGPGQFDKLAPSKHCLQSGPLCSGCRTYHHEEPTQPHPDWRYCPTCKRTALAYEQEQKQTEFVFGGLWRTA